MFKIDKTIVAMAIVAMADLIHVSYSLRQLKYCIVANVKSLEVVCMVCKFIFKTVSSERTNILMCSKTPYTYNTIQ